MSLPVAAEHLDCFLAVLYEMHRRAPVVEHLANDESICSIVFRHQNGEILSGRCSVFWRLR
jgi:hypothetical protein